MSTTVSMIAAVTLSVLALGGSPAHASVDDSTGVDTNWPSLCPDNYAQPAGQLRFVDYGLGAPGGGNNDDYLEVRDLCGDGDGVVGYAWLNGKYLGWKYNGNGSGTFLVWDPFPNGNVAPKQKVKLKVCSIDGGVAGTEYNCQEKTFVSQDG